MGRVVEKYDKHTNTNMHAYTYNLYKEITKAGIRGSKRLKVRYLRCSGKASMTLEQRLEVFRGDAYRNLEEEYSKQKQQVYKPGRDYTYCVEDIAQ